MIRFIAGIMVTSLFLLLNPGQVIAFNVIDIAKSIGCNSQNDIDNLVLSIPVNSYEEDLILDPETNKKIKFIWEKIKALERADFESESQQAYKYGSSLYNLKYRCNEYFEQYEKLSAYIKEQQTRIDIFAFLQELNIPSTLEKFNEWENSFQHYKRKDTQNLEKCQSANRFLNAMRDKKVKDFNISNQERKDLVKSAVNITFQLEKFLTACDQTAEQDKADLAFRKNAPSDLVKTFAGTEKPKSFDLYKEMISLLDDWKIMARKAYDRTEWEFYSKDSRSKDADIIFKNLPIDADIHEGQYFFLEVEVTGKLEDKFILTSPRGEQYQALAVIPKKMLKKSGAKFNHKFYFVVNLKDVINVTTVGGTSKPICVLNVVVMADGDEYNEFMKYISGHPDEFSPEKYVEIIFDN